VKRITLLTILILILISTSFGLNRDSLINVIQNPDPPDSSKKQAAITLMIKTWQDDPNFLRYIKISDSLARAIKDKELKAYVNLNYGQYFNFTDHYDSARFYLKRAYDYFKNTDNLRFKAASCGEMGNSYCFNGDYRQCLQWLLKAQEIITQVGDTPWIAVNLNNIGNVYYYLSDKKKALKYYFQSYNLFKKTHIAQGIALSANNIGTVYSDWNILDSAKKYFFIAIANAEKSNYIEQLTETYTHLAEVYSGQNKADSAHYYIKQSIKLARESQNQNQLAEDFRIIAQILTQKGDFPGARAYLDSALTLARKIGSREITKNIYLTAFQLDTAEGKYQAAISKYLRYIELKDSLQNEKTQKDIANLQSVYQLKLAEKENKLLKEEQEKQKLAMRQQRIIIVSILVLLLISSGFIIILSRQNRIIKHINSELKAKNQEIIRKNAVLNSQKEEILAQKEEIERQHKELMLSQKKINESINYAQRIQQALLPDTSLFRKYFTEVMILYLPRDVVSGDFYWAAEVNGKFYFAVGDCTGHGVPGAFMSIMVITMLKEIVSMHPEISSAQILNIMREGIKKALGQTDAKQIFMDGVDMAMCIYNPDREEINFAGAYRPLYIIRDKQLQIIKGDRQPVGIYIKEKFFTDNFITLKKQDVLYLFSDGYMDQLSAKTLKKFTLHKFKDLLQEIHNLPMEEQKQVLLQRLNEWKKDYPQIDDIVILGLKV